MAFPFILAGASLASGIASIFSDKATADAANERIRRMQALMAEGLVDSGEIANRLRGVDRMFNQRLNAVLNTTALRSRGFANQGTIGAAVAGGVEGARLEAHSNILDSAYNSNRQTRTQIAMAGLGEQSANPVGAFTEGAAAGAMLGNEIQNTLNIGTPRSFGSGASPGGMAGSPLQQQNVGGNVGNFGGNVSTGSPFGGQVNLPSTMIGREYLFRPYTLRGRE